MNYKVFNAQTLSFLLSLDLDKTIKCPDSLKEDFSIIYSDDILLLNVIEQGSLLDTPLKSYLLDLMENYTHVGHTDDVVYFVHKTEIVSKIQNSVNPYITNLSKQHKAWKNCLDHHETIKETYPNVDFLYLELDSRVFFEPVVFDIIKSLKIPIDNPNYYWVSFSDFVMFTAISYYEVSVSPEEATVLLDNDFDVTNTPIVKPDTSDLVLSREEVLNIQEDLENFRDYLNSEIHPRCDYDIYNRIADLLGSVESVFDK